MVISLDILYFKLHMLCAAPLYFRYKDKDLKL